MQIIQSTSHTELQKRFWSSFREALEILTPKEYICIWLSGGSSLDIFYSHIREHFGEIPEDIRKKIRFAFLDERVVPVDHPDSNEWQLREKFLDELVEKGSIGENQILGIWFRHFERSDSEVEKSHPYIAWDYSEWVPYIDIALFWVGPDGHIASLFPHHPLLDSREKNYLEITDSPKPPAHRITVSPRMIGDIPYVFVAIMQGKEEVFRRLWGPEISVEDCPVKMLLQSERLVVMSDIDE